MTSPPEKMVVDDRVRGNATEQKLLAAQDKSRAKVHDRRRHKVTSVPTGKIRTIEPLDAKGTKFPHTVMKWTETTSESILKDGAHNSKIGGDVLKGKLRGAKIYTLALEERATCPKSCDLWQQCYGNNLQRTRRWVNDLSFEWGVEREVRAMCSRLGGADTILVRLHQLGDFYSMNYLSIWVELLDDFPNLNVFGFTAWKPDTEIGSAISRVRKALGLRFAIRHSGMTGPFGSFTVDFPTDKKTLGDAVICPEQNEAMASHSERHCGNCTLCWSSDKPIIFVEH